MHHPAAYWGAWGQRPQRVDRLVLFSPVTELPILSSRHCRNLRCPLCRRLLAESAVRTLVLISAPACRLVKCTVAHGKNAAVGQLAKRVLYSQSEYSRGRDDSGDALMDHDAFEQPYVRSR
ncbi:hypothetical protein PAXRUDRAFT_761471 [Paxillus rubicundulus Ve08.2h10]|uniref:Uncharacterized protein n=1 Tax=Paxillus rubicundulus Ve08.2h10 TaxID=930991 RepID=A0A0D0DB91_9AGAM|nr:hypothetical protein PAXRUDRAFT_761471 [Paxillus rubicundulus Ve08.2h10]